MQYTNVKMKYHLVFNETKHRLPIKQHISSNITGYIDTRNTQSVSSSKVVGKGSIPSPQGDLRVVMWRTLVGILTGPLTLSCLSLAPFTKSAQTAIK
jgi:hypothetical protein